MADKRVAQRHILERTDHTQLSVHSRVVRGFFISVLCTGLIALISTALIPYPMIEPFGALIIGTIIGGIGISPLFVQLVKRVKIRSASLICFGLASLCACFVSLRFEDEIFNLVAGFVGFFIGMVLSLCFAPRYSKLKYARCPECQYSLVGLPINLPCPECGRDNSDLADRFKDLLQ